MILFASALVACSGDDSVGAQPADAGADVTVVADAASDTGSTIARQDASADAVGDSTSDVLSISDASDAGSDGESDGAIDAGADADATSGQDAAPLYGTQMTGALPSGAVPFWLGGGGAGPLILGGTTYASTPYFVTLEAIDPADAGVTYLADFLTYGTFLHATNGEVVVYSDPASQNLTAIPSNGSGPPESLPSYAVAGCDAFGLDMAHLYCASFGGKGVIVSSAPLAAADAGAFGQIAYVLESARPSKVVVSGSTLDVVEQLYLTDGGAQYAIEAYPSDGLPDGGAPIVVGTGPGTVLEVANSGTSLCYTIFTGPAAAGSYGLACASTTIAGQETTVVAPSATQLGGLALEPPTVWYATPNAIERTTIGGGGSTQVTLALESVPPTLAIDATHVYWAAYNGSIWEAPR